MKSDSFFNKDSRKLRSGKLFIGEVMEYFSGMKGCFVVVPKDVSEKKTEHLMVWIKWNIKKWMTDDYIDFKS